MNRILLTFISIIISSFALYSQSLSGSWTGKLQVTPQASLKLVFHISEEPSVSIDSPDQGAYGIKGEICYLSADSINFKVPKLMMSYEGHLHDSKIDGTFRQGGIKLPLTLESGERKSNRPQTPQPPFPYSTENITVSHDNVSLAGTLTIPANSDSNTPVVVMVTGSGLQNRDEELFDHKPFAVIADYLARNGIASVRYDDRGCGDSKGDASTATTEDFANDALSVINWLRNNKKYDKIGMLGHSEGGMISYMLGARPNTLDFIVSIAGPAVRGDSILVFQNLNNLAKSGITGPVADRFEEALHKAFQLKIDNPEMTLSDNDLSEIYPTYNESVITQKLAEGIRGLFSGNVNPWMQYFIGYSPSAALSSIKIPAFLIYGEKDMQVPASLNAGTAKMLASEATIKVYPDLNHLMQHAITGNVEEYSQIEETISPEVLSDIVGFIDNLKK